MVKTIPALLVLSGASLAVLGCSDRAVQSADVSDAVEGMAKASTQTPGDFDLGPLPALNDEYQSRLVTENCSSDVIRSLYVPLKSSDHVLVEPSRTIRSRLSQLQDEYPRISYNNMASFSDIDVKFERNFTSLFGIMNESVGTQDIVNTYTVSEVPSEADLTGQPPGTVWRLPAVYSETKAGKSRREGVDAQVEVRFDGCSEVDVDGETFATAIWTGRNSWQDVDDLTGLDRLDSWIYRVEIAPKLNWYATFAEDDDQVYRWDSNG